MFVFDTERGMWQREVCSPAGVCGFAYVVGQGLYMLERDGVLSFLRGTVPPADYISEGAVASLAEFGDFTENDPNVDGVTKLQIRVALDAGAEISVYIAYDRSGAWQHVKSLTTTPARSFYLAVVPRRCDSYRVRIVGSGGWRLYSLTRESYSGSELI